jgi:hypothetical protein
MRNSLYDPFAWIMIPIGIYATLWQVALLGIPATVTRDQLGRFGRGQ